MARFAPIALFVFNRPEHTRHTLDALSRNYNAAQTDLYVFSDGSRDERDADSVATVRTLINNIHGFARCTVIEQPVNLGLANSIISGVSEILKTYENIIVLEDDLITSRHFINYMNDALQFYKDDAKAFSVTAHTLPSTHLRVPEDYKFDTYAGYRCSSWSWGTWKDRWEAVNWSMGYYRKFLQDRHAQDEFARGGKDLNKMLRLQFEGRIDSWAIRYCYAHFQNDMRCIYPTKTLVTNIGLDNSGVHSHPDERFVHPSLDNEWRPSKFCPAQLVDPRISADFKMAMEGPAKTPRREPKTFGQRLSRVRTSLLKRLSWLHSQPANKRSNVDVLFASTYQRRDNASLAAWLLFTGIRAVRPASRFLCLYRDDRDGSVVGLDRNSPRGMLARYLERRELSKLGRDTGLQSSLPAIRPNPVRIRLDRFQPSLLHLHSVKGGLLDAEELRRLDCPIVWTLHDAWAFTGGCHYPDTCQKLLSTCGECPRLESHAPDDLSHKLMLQKIASYNDLDLTIVTPSTSLAAAARQSALFAQRKIEIIPNGIDTDLFYPRAGISIRHRLGIPDQIPMIVFGGSHSYPKSNETGLLVRALAKLDTSFSLVTLGRQSLGSHHLPPHIRIHEVGVIDDSEFLAEIYSAADVFVCTSQETYFHMDLAKALACGTPCIAFATDGLSEMITHKVNGWLATPFDPSALAEGIRWLTGHSCPDDLRAAARAKAVTEYRLDVTVEKYADLYARVLREWRKMRRVQTAPKRFQTLKC